MTDIDRYAEEICSAANVVSHDGYYEIDIDAVSMVLKTLADEARAEGFAAGSATAVAAAMLTQR